MNENSEKEIYLPQELFLEILSWLDVASVLRLKTVCKKWRSLIEGRAFMRAHKKRSIGRWFFGKRYSDPRTSDYAYLDSDYGVLLEHKNTKSYRLRNPSTGEILELPDPVEEGSWEMKICHIHSSDILKLAIPGIYYENGKQVFKVLTVGINVTWREIDIPLSDGACIHVRETAMVGEVYFMFCLNDMTEGLDVLCLEMGNEEIYRVEVPNSFFSNALEDIIIPLAWGENFALARVVKDEEFHIWVLEDHKTATWTEKKIIIPLKFVDPQAKGRRIDFLRFYDNVLEVNCEGNEIMLLDVPSGNIRRLFRAPEGQNTFPYYLVPSFHLLSHGNSN